MAPRYPPPAAAAPEARFGAAAATAAAANTAAPNTANTAAAASAADELVVAGLRPKESALLAPAFTPTIYMTRHGQSMYNLTEQIGGDPELSALGKRYAAALGSLLLSLYPPEAAPPAEGLLSPPASAAAAATASADLEAGLEAEARTSGEGDVDGEGEDDQRPAAKPTAVASATPQATSATAMPSTWSRAEIDRARRFLQDAFANFSLAASSASRSNSDVSQSAASASASAPAPAAPRQSPPQPLAVARINESVDDGTSLVDFHLPANPAVSMAMAAEDARAAKDRAASASASASGSFSSIFSSASSVGIPADAEGPADTLAVCRGMLSPPVSSDEEAAAASKAGSSAEDVAGRDDDDDDDAEIEDNDDEDDEDDDNDGNLAHAASNTYAHGRLPTATASATAAATAAAAEAASGDGFRFPPSSSRAAADRRSPSPKSNARAPRPFRRHFSEANGLSPADTAAGDIGSNRLSSWLPPAPATSAAHMAAGPGIAVDTQPRAAPLHKRPLSAKMAWSPSAPTLIDPEQAATIAHVNRLRMNHLAASVHIPESSLEQLFKGCSVDNAHRRASTPSGTFAMLSRRRQVSPTAARKPATMSRSPADRDSSNNGTSNIDDDDDDDDDVNDDRLQSSAAGSASLLAQPVDLAAFPTLDAACGGSGSGAQLASQPASPASLARRQPAPGSNPTPRLMIHTSSLKRTISTSAHMLHAFPATHSSILDEIGSGQFDHYTYDEIKRDFPKEADARKKDKLGYRYPSGESYEDLLSRVAPVVDAVIADKPILSDRHVLLISHQATLRCVYGALRGVSKELVPELDIPLHTLIRIRFVNGRWEETRFRWDDASDTFHASDPILWQDPRAPAGVESR